MQSRISNMLIKYFQPPLNTLFIGNNEFEVGGLWQQIHGGTNVNMKIREEFGHHLKCALKHRFFLHS